MAQRSKSTATTVASVDFGHRKSWVAKPKALTDEGLSGRISVYWELLAPPAILDRPPGILLTTPQFFGKAKNSSPYAGEPEIGAALAGFAL